MKRRLKPTETTTDQEIRQAVEDYRLEGEGLADVDQAMLQEMNIQADRYLSKRKVPTIGSVPTKKADGTWRWLFGNVNGLATHRARNYKASQLSKLNDTYDFNGLAFCEVGVDTRCFKASESITSFLQIEDTTRLSMAHNKYQPKISLGQQGGCCVVAMGETCQYAKVTKGANDPRNLGRFSSMVLSSHPDQRFRVVSAYNVGRPKPKGLKTVYQQTLRYIQEEAIEGTPRQLMRSDLITQLKAWLKEGDRILLYMDANENVLNGPLCRQLEAIGFAPWAHKMHGIIPNTHVEGSECIDEVWGSYGVEVTAVQVLSFHESIGDHRSFIVDFTTRSTIGLFHKHIVLPDCRRLVNSNKQCVEKYLEIVEQQWKYHRMEDRLVALTTLQDDYPVAKERSEALERLDVQATEILRCGEKNCRKIAKIDGEYSIVSKYWHEKMQCLKDLERRLDGNTRNDGNICRTARRHNIPRPRQLTREQIREQYKIAYHRKKTLKPQSKFLRKQHLREIRAKAEVAKDKEKAADITAMMLREEGRSMWKRIGKVTRAPRTGALMRVEREIDGEIYEFTEEHDLINNIMEELQDRFSGAEDAPISNCSITEDLGVFGFTELGLKIVAGDFDAPEDMRESTARLLAAIGKVGIEHRDDDIDVAMTTSNYASTWGRAKERTSSSISGLHFGHHIALAKSKFLAKSMAMKLNLHAKWGSPPERWLNVLMVMLEKKMGVALIPKLRAILLKEADGNMLDGHVFGGKALTHAREIGFIPEEQLAEKQKTAEDGVWAKVLKADYARLRREALAILAADAANCYDMVNHIILCLLLMAIGVPIGAIICMLSTIMSMKYFLRTGFGISNKYMGSEMASKRRHGLNQGSRAAPPCWTIVSSLLVAIQRAQGHVATVVTPISKIITIIVGYLYVDDTDLYVMSREIFTNDELFMKAQAALDDWGWHLIDTGGGCKAVKSFGHLLNYGFDEGQWYCESLVEGYSLTVPTLTGPEEIELCAADEGKETLGVVTAPDGNSTGHFQKVKDKLDTWIARIKVGRLPVSFNWTSYIYQLWMGLRYGIGTLPADREETNGILQSSNRELLPYLGVNRNIRTGWRTLHRSFLGIGLFDFEIEMNIQRINLFLQHYDSPFDIGITLRATMELVQLEVGFRDCPLLHPFEPYGRLVTHCWFRSFWEALDYYGLRLHVEYPEIQIPRERDVLLIDVYKRSGWGMEYWVSWNRCRISCKALFLSDITTPDGKQIDNRYLNKDVMRDPPLSAYDFGREEPSDSDWEMWSQFWHEYTYPSLVLVISLGPWICSSHRPNEWFYNQEADSLFRRVAGGGYYYGRVNSIGRSRSQQRFYLLGPAPAIPDLSTHVPVGVERTADGEVILGSTGPARYDPPPIQLDLFALLRSWGGEWMWESIEVVGSLQSIVEAYKNGTSLWCTDGSYDRVVMPEVSSSGWTVFDPKTTSHIKGCFFEVSGEAAAGSYRGELLGLTALHLVACAMKELYGDPNSRNLMICDNESALNRAAEFRRRISTTAHHNDLLRLLRNVKPLLSNHFHYKHVYGHADKTKKWKDLTLEEQLNVFCDHLAKSARWKSIFVERDTRSQTLPKEKAALFLHRTKQTSDISESVRFFLARTQAREFYINELKWTSEQFEEVDWDSLHLTLKKKKNMYSLWLAKQASTFCGSRLQVSRMTPGADDRCPNCLMPEERSTHLNLCRDNLRTRQFQESVDDLRKWMESSTTHPELLFWLPKYLLARNRCSFEQLPSFAPSTAGLTFSSQMKAIVIGQDKIGWTHFLEGKVTGHIRPMQQMFLKSQKARINGQDWIKQLITRLIKISHTQWIVRNITLHDRQHGHLANIRREELAAEMERLHSLDPSEVPEESRFLLDFDIDDLAEGDVAKQEHWILAMRAARVAGMRVQGRRVRWAKLPKRRRRRHDPPTRVFPNPTLQDTLRGEVFGELDVPVRKRPSEAVLSLLEPSNKRKRRRKKREENTSSYSA
jgi:hypothetical protein